MTDQAVELRQNDREKVLEVFTRQLPHTALITNPPRVTEEIVFGPDHETPDDDELPPQEWYDRHQAVMDELVAEGILQTGETMGMTVYGLTVAYQDLLRDQVMLWLANKKEQIHDKHGDPDYAAQIERVRQIIAPGAPA